MGRLLLLGLGGAVGTWARYGMALLARSLLGTAFPYGTIAVNLIGSFLLGILMRASFGSEVFTAETRLILGTGVMGGFTTYSSFSYESVSYFDRGAWGLGALYMGTTFVGCAVCSVLGILVGKRFAGV